MNHIPIVLSVVMSVSPGLASEIDCCFAGCIRGHSNSRTNHRVNDSPLRFSEVAENVVSCVPPANRAAAPTTGTATAASHKAVLDLDFRRKFFSFNGASKTGNWVGSSESVSSEADGRVSDDSVVEGLVDNFDGVSTSSVFGAPIKEI